MLQQLAYFAADLKRLVGSRKSRYISIWLSRSFFGVFSYRMERGLFLTFGGSYAYLRVVLIPLLNLIQAYSNIDISYKADIGKGLKVLHPSGGVVVSSYACIGDNLSLTGGNFIGAKRGCPERGITLGDCCYLGANATVIGPIRLGSRTQIGANSCAVTSYPEEKLILVGVPARPLRKSEEETVPGDRASLDS